MSCDVLIALVGDHTAICADEPSTLNVTVKRGSVIGTMARMLLLEGYDGEQRMLVFRNKTLCFEPMSINKWAEISLSEGEQSIHFTKYTKDPRWETE